MTPVTSDARRVRCSAGGSTTHASGRLLALPPPSHFAHIPLPPSLNPPPPPFPRQCPPPPPPPLPQRVELTPTLYDKERRLMETLMKHGGPGVRVLIFCSTKRYALHGAARLALAPPFSVPTAPLPTRAQPEPNPCP